MTQAPQPFFLSLGDGHRYCLFHPAQGTPRGAVLHVHPFAEEMNKTRRMAARQARALAAAGHAVLQIDLLGCGDSSGDFGDARWQQWIDDLLHARRWLADRLAQYGPLPMWFWGVRAGCLLAADAARSWGGTTHLLLWQPSFTDGAMALQQFLRLRLAADLIAAPDAAGRARGAMDALHRQLINGDALQIAGYMLHPELAAGLRASRLAPWPAGEGARLVWLEVVAGAEPVAGPGATRSVPRWQECGWHVELSAVQGPAFWQTSEIEESPALLEATVAALSRAGVA